MNQNVPMFLHARASARACGDHALERAVQADLDRIGYVEPTAAVERVETETGHDTTTVRAPERAVPQAGKRRGGRPPLPRCEHNQIVGRCGKCKRAA